jgi:tripartite-type tricarboxylate transporter receptor subunit TctC
MPFDPERDFAPVVGIGISPMMIVVHPSLPVRTVAELVDLAKANPGGLDFAASGARNIPHFTGMLLNLLTGAPLVHVPYRGSAQAMQDVQAGQLKVMIDGVPSLRQHVASGAVRAVAVTSPRRLPGFEAVPAIAETLPGFSTVGWFAILAPTGTPAEAVARVNRDFDRLLAEPEMKRRLEEFGIFDGGGTPEQLAVFIAGERKAWGEFVRRAKIAPE